MLITHNDSYFINSTRRYNLECVQSLLKIAKLCLTTGIFVVVKFFYLDFLNFLCVRAHILRLDMHTILVRCESWHNYGLFYLKHTYITGNKSEDIFKGK